MSERKRFHPLAIIIYGFNGLKSWLFLIVLLFINGSIQSNLGKGALAVIILWVLGQSLWKYFSRTYQISSEKIILYRGIFRKKETDIPYERIQTIKQRQWFFFKPFHTIQLFIETAGGAGAEAEASMPAVDIELLELIEQYRQGEFQKQELTEIDTSILEKDLLVPDYRVTNGQIILHGLTDLSILATLLAVIAFFSEFIPENWLTTATSMAENIWRTGWLFMLSFLFIVMLIVLLLSLVKTFIQYYHFQVTRTQNTLTIESGLFERRIQKVPLEKIQALKIRQQPLRKLLGISSVELLLAGGQAEGETIKKLYILPVISNQYLYKTLDLLLPEWNFKEPDIHSVSRNKKWYFLRWNLLLVPVSIGLIFVNRWLVAAVVVILLLLLLHSWLKSYFQGYEIQSGTQICVQNVEGFTKVQLFVERKKIQTFSEQTSKWLFPNQIGHMKMYIKAGLAGEAIALHFIDFSHIQILKNFYQQQVNYIGTEVPSFWEDP